MQKYKIELIVEADNEDLAIDKIKKNITDDNIYDVKEYIEDDSFIGFLSKLLPPIFYMVTFFASIKIVFG